LLRCITRSRWISFGRPCSATFTLLQWPMRTASRQSSSCPMHLQRSPQYRSSLSSIRRGSTLANIPAMWIGLPWAWRASSMSFTLLMTLAFLYCNAIYRSFFAFYGTENEPGENVPGTENEPSASELEKSALNYLNFVDNL
jgi:hypothetical protein